MGLIDHIHGKGDERLGFLVDERKPPHLAAHSADEIAVLRIDGPEPVLQLLVVEHRVLLCHVRSPRWLIGN